MEPWTGHPRFSIRLHTMSLIATLYLLSLTVSTICISGARQSQCPLWHVEQRESASVSPLSEDVLNATEILWFCTITYV